MPPKKTLVKGTKGVKAPKVVALLSDSESENSLDSGSDSNFETDPSDYSSNESDAQSSDSIDEYLDEKEPLALEEKKIDYYEEDESVVLRAEPDDFNSLAMRVEERRTVPILSRYERTRAIGVRATQLAAGAKPLVKNVGELPPEKIAELELKERVCPLYIYRPLPNNQYELFHINELEILDD